MMKGAGVVCIKAQLLHLLGGSGPLRYTCHNIRTGFEEVTSQVAVRPSLKLCSDHVILTRLLWTESSQQTVWFCLCHCIYGCMLCVLLCAVVCCVCCCVLLCVVCAAVCCCVLCVLLCAVVICVFLLSLCVFLCLCIYS